MPIVILSTVAAIIASQAVISGAFSVTRKAIRLGFLPRLSIDDLGYRDDGITHITGRFGFQDPLNVPALMRQVAERGVEGNPRLDDPSYFVSKIQIIATDRPGMAKWRKKLFLAISRNAANPVEVFHLPDERTVVMGSHIEL